MKTWEDIRKNPPENWRETWDKRHKVSRSDTRNQALNLIEKLQSSFDMELEMDIHPKDGYVIYFNHKTEKEQ